MAVKGLLERLNAGEDVVVAEGYCFEFERRGYLKAGHYVPEVVMKWPELVKQVHREYVHAGSDVTQAFTYYCNRRKIEQIKDTGIDLEAMYMQALNIAKEVSVETGTLLAGDICNTTQYIASDPEKIEFVKEMFKEQVEWLSRVGVDFIVLETFGDLGEARLAVEACRKYYPDKQIPLVVTFSVRRHDDVLQDGVPVVEACRLMEREGADVVGLNCSRGPATMLPLLEKIRAVCKGHIAALPVPYRTTDKHKTFQRIPRLCDDEIAMPEDMEELMVSRTTIAEFTKRAREIGVHYLGICCGNMSCYTRKMAEALGRRPPASLYSPDMLSHEAFLDDSVTDKTLYTTKVGVV